MGCQLVLIVIALISGLCVGGLRHSIKQSDEEVREGKRSHRLTGGWTFAFVLVVLSLMWNWACLSSKSVHTSLSPDAAWQLVIEQRCAFPRNELVDPSQVIRFRIIDSKTGETLACESVVVAEQSDYRTPDVKWIRGGVQVEKFDSRRPRQLDILANKN